MARAKPKPAAKPTRRATPRFVLTPAEREVEAIRERRRKLWRKLGSLEAVEKKGREVHARLSAARKSAKKRSA